MFKKFTCWLLAILMVLSICIVPAAAETTTLPGTGSAKGKTVTLSVTPRTQKIPRSTEDTYVTFDITITPPERQKIAAFSFALAELTGMTLAAPEGNWWKLNSAALAKNYAQVSFSPSYTRYFGAGGSINGGISAATRVMSVTMKIPADTAPGDYYLRVVTESEDKIDIFTAGLKNGDQYDRKVVYTPVTVVDENGIHGRIRGTGDESVTYTLYREDRSEPVLQGSAIDEFYWFGVSDGTYRLEISGGNIVTRSFDVTVKGQSISDSEDIRVAQYGDVNGTGEVDISDVACLYEYLTTNENSGTLSDDYLEEVADLNSDDAVDVYDLQFLYEVVSGISSIGKQPSGETGAYRIGIVTGSVSQSEDDRRGAEAFQAEYGEDMVTLAIYPDNFTEEIDTTIRNIVNLSQDPLMKAIVVNQAVPGTTEAFRKIKESRPDIICIAGEAHEDLPEISSAADLVCNNDFVSRGYLIIRTAHELGCDTFVHISFPRHLAYETISRRVAIMREACKEFGMKFVLETAPDPISDVGVSGAQAYILEKVPEWVQEYGLNTAYFCTNDAHIEPLLKQLLEYGGYYIEGDFPSPLLGYPGALGLDLTEEAGDFEMILAKVESAINERGGAGHFGTWAYPYGYTLSAGLAQHAKNVIDGNADICDMDDVATALQKYSPKAEWNGAGYTNATTGVKSDNVFLIYQDTYIMGNPGKFMGNTDVDIPERYFTIN